MITKTSQEIKNELKEINIKLTKYKNVPLVNVYLKFKFNKLVKLYAFLIQKELKNKKYISKNE